MKKTCSKCKTEKEITEFHKTSHKYRPDNGHETDYKYYHAKCKKCRNDEKKIYLINKKKEN